jgi:thiol-disulfide isomerase/thioredoxin
MKTTAILMILFAAGITPPAWAEDRYSMDSFWQNYSAVTEDSQMISLCEDFLIHAGDMEVVREAANHWRTVDPEGLTLYLETACSDFPDSSRFLYLLGRIVEDPLEQIRLGREVIRLSPQSAHGYRLVLATYDQRLFNQTARTDARAALRNALPQDTAGFATLLALEPGKDYPYRFLADYLLYEKNSDSALSVFNAATTLGLSWPAATDYASLYAGLGRYPEALQAVADYVEAMIADGSWKGTRQHYLDLFYSDALRSAGAYAEWRRYLQARPGFEADSSACYDIACAFSLQGGRDSAFAYLTRAVESGFSRVRHLQSDPDLDSLHEDARWSALVASVRASWEEGREARRRNALARKIDSLAPDWTLRDAAGNLQRLTDLRGNVVVLDFWATWCGYCDLAMPLIDEFARRNTRSDLKILAIDIMEKGQAHVKRYFQQKGYSMQLLYGTEDTQKAYAINSIPFLVVIDKEGRIRYSDLGYHEDLADCLTFWTEDLLKK